jgi:hypothetical protein
MFGATASRQLQIAFSKSACQARQLPRRVASWFVKLACR